MDESYILHLDFDEFQFLNSKLYFKEIMLFLKYMLLIGSAAAWTWSDIFTAINPWRLHDLGRAQQHPKLQVG